ncbi:MAG: hypothetical protein K6F29_07250 [Bacteroidales bacterium]|nr:hypothetical protein [Bacteroidales bacterium]
MIKDEDLRKLLGDWYTIPTILSAIICLIGIIAEKCHDHYYDKKYNRNETKDIIIEDDTSHYVEDIQNNNTAIGAQNTYFLSVADLADGDGQDAYSKVYLSEYRK